MEDGVGRSAKNVSISNVNDANNFRKKVQQTKQVDRSIQNSFLRSPSKSYFGADRSERSPVSQGRWMASSRGRSGARVEPAEKESPSRPKHQQADTAERRTPAKIFGAQGHRSQAAKTVE